MTYVSKPWGMNAERAMKSPFQHRALTKEWREAFAWLVKAQRIPPLKFITVEVQPIIKNRRFGGDVCFGCAPSAKAGLDSLADCKVIPDDTPEYIRSITFLAPQIGPENALTITITGEPVSVRTAKPKRST